MRTEEVGGAEERELLARSEEPGFFSLALGIFRGPLGWVHLLLMAVQILFFVAGIYAAWHFFHSADPVTQLRWGLPAVVLILAAIVIRFSLMSSLQANRLMHELKRIELQIVRTRPD